MQNYHDEGVAKIVFVTISAKSLITRDVPFLWNIDEDDLNKVIALLMAASESKCNMHTTDEYFVNSLEFYDY